MPWGYYSDEGLTLKEHILLLESLSEGSVW